MRRERATFSPIRPSAPGHDRSFARYRSSASSPQLAVVLPPTPRGSKLTTSYAPSSSPSSAFPFLVSACTPDPPGPPGMNSNVPRRACGSSLRTRETASVNCRPPGFP